MPRNSVSYKASEMPQNDSIIAKNTNYSTVSSKQMTECEKVNEYETRIKNWTKGDKPALPSERRKDVEQLSRTLRHYQSLKRAIADDKRKTAYGNNRWREGVGQVINTTKGDPAPSFSKGRRTNAFLKYLKRHQDLQNTSSTYLLFQIG